MTTIILNYSHPLTDEQKEQIRAIVPGEHEIRVIAHHADRQRPMEEIAIELVEAAKLTSDQWQTQPLIINPPALAPLALTLIAEIHGRSGYFPPVLNIRPIEGALPPRYEVAEILNLQAIRDTARNRR
jgi:hypothetical protein